MVNNVCICIGDCLFLALNIELFDFPVSANVASFTRSSNEDPSLSQCGNENKPILTAQY